MPPADLRFSNRLSQSCALDQARQCKPEARSPYRVTATAGSSSSGQARQDKSSMATGTRPIRVAVADRPPLLSIDRAADGTNIYSGLLWELLPTLLQQAHINSTYTVYEANVGSGGKMANGSWTGMMGELTSGRADLALFPLTMTAQRAAAVSYTIPFMSDGYGLVVQQQQVSAGYSSFLMPFDTMLWVMLFVALVAFSVLCFGLDYASRRARLKAIEKAHGNFKLQKQRSRDRLMDQAMANTMMAFGQGEAPRTHSISIKVWSVAWAFFCVIMLNSYTANLTANLTTSQLTGSLSSVSDLAQSGRLFGVPADSSVSHYFQTSYDDVARKLRPRMVEFGTYEEGADALRSGRVAAFVCDFPDAVHITQLPPCDLTLGSESIQSGQLVLGLAPNSTLTTSLNMALMELSEAGYLAVLRRRWFIDADQCHSANATTSHGRIGLPEIWSVFMIPIAGGVLALLVLLGEIVYYRKFYKGVQQLKHDVAQVGPIRAFSKRMDSRLELSSSLRSLQTAPTLDSMASQQPIPEYDQFDPELGGGSPMGASSPTGGSPVSNRSYGYGHSDSLRRIGDQRTQRPVANGAATYPSVSRVDTNGVISANGHGYPSVSRVEANGATGTGDSPGGYPTISRMDNDGVNLADGHSPSDMTVRVHR